MAYNKIILDPEGQGDDSFIRKTNLDWVSITVTSTTFTSYQYTTNEVQTYDSLFNGYDMQTTTFLDPKEAKSFPYYLDAYNGKNLGGVMLEMSPDTIITTRTRYNFSSFLNDFGGW